MVAVHPLDSHWAAPKPPLWPTLDELDLAGLATDAELAALNGASPDFLSYDVTVDTVEAAALITGQGRDVNGYVFKANASVETGYGKGQAFLILEEGAGDATDQSAAGSVLFRIDRHGSMGTSGGLHIASGLRTAYAGSQAVWIDPSVNTIGLVIHNPSVAEAAAWTADFMRIVDVRASNAVRFAVNPTGQTVVGAPSGDPSTPGLSWAGDLDTGIYHASADWMGFACGGSAIMDLNTARLALADGKNIAFGTGTGTKIGVTTTQKIGFYGATPVARPAGVAVTAAGIHAALVSLGLIAA